jgi:hypothetical protein
MIRALLVVNINITPEVIMNLILCLTDIVSPRASKSSPGRCLQKQSVQRQDIRDESGRLLSKLSES